MTSPILELQHVSQTYQTGARIREAVIDLSMAVFPGQHLSIVGQNGSGKTTLLRVLLGLNQPTAGWVRHNLSPSAQIHWLPQDYREALLPWMSFGSNLSIAFRRDSRFSNGDPSALRSAFELLANEFKLNLHLDAAVFRASGGEMQLFLLVRALLGPPDLLVLDEPLSAVDFGRRQIIRQFLGRDLVDRAITSVIATHDFDDAVLLSDMVMVLAKNRAGFVGKVVVNLPWPRTLEMRDLPVYRQTVEEVISLVLQ